MTRHPAKALEKLHASANKIGYGTVATTIPACGSFAAMPSGNDRRATEFEFQREIRKIGQPVDRSEWGMTPPP